MRPLSSNEIRILIKEAEQIVRQQRGDINFGTGMPRAEIFLRNINKFPHHFVLACVMDRQIRANRAWAIPYKVGAEIGGFDFASYEKLDLARATKVFRVEQLHRFNNNMAKYFVEAVKRIRREYNGNAGQIWADTPSAAGVIRRFLEFQGVGIKIATMATNILTRQFRIPMKDKSAIDISPDVQVMKFFKERGLLRESASIPELIYRARELSPKYPGLLDALAWEGGRSIRRGKTVGVTIP